MAKTMTVMVVARGGRKKDRFHLLRDLWEIMGVVVLLLRKENICRDLVLLPKERLVLGKVGFKLLMWSKKLQNILKGTLHKI